MTTPVCPTCGTGHGPGQRYCLGCGALVGARAVEIEQALALTADGAPSGELPAATAVPPSADADTAVWRRPATSIATALALAVGITVGFLTGPQGGDADDRAAVVLNSQPAASAEPPTADDPPLEAGTPDAPDPVEEEPPPPADGEQPAADPVAGPSADDAAPASPDDPAPVDPDPASATGAAKAPAKTTKADADRRAATSTADRRRAGLPRIDHVWLIGVGSPVSGRDGGYLADVLLPRGTELARYAPTSTDPAIGGAALVAGREPSARTKTIVTELTTAQRSWRAYAPGTPNCSDAPGGIPLLRFPTVPALPDCDDRVSGLESLTADVAKRDAVPAFSYVATDPALDAAALDEQLRGIVEPIRRSAAYKQAGLIAIVPTAADPIAPTGALILSPFAAGSTAVSTRFGPYSLLRTVADLLGVDRPGHAADKDVPRLGPEILTPKD